MKAVIFFAILLITSSYCMNLKSLSKSNSKIASQLKELQTTKLGKLLYSLVEVHMYTNGPLDELFQEIANLQASVQDSIDSENTWYDGVVADNAAEVQIINSQISGAQSDIDTYSSSLNSVLYPQLANLQQNAEDLASNIDNTNSQIQSGQAQRDADAAVFAQFKFDSNDAISALTEAINFMNQLVNQPPSEGTTQAMIQIKRAKTNLKSLTQKKLLKNNLYTPLIKALISLAQNFSDQDTVNKIVELLNNVLNTVTENLTNAQSNEIAAQGIWAEQLNQLQEFSAQLSGQLDETNNQINDTQNQIAEYEANLAAAQDRLALWQGNLDAENAKFDNLTQVHESAIAELTDEQNTVFQAAAILDSARTSLSDYVQGVMNVE